MTGPAVTDVDPRNDPVATDVHQHVWPAALTEALRARHRRPRLRGGTLQLDGEPDYLIDPAEHDPAARARLVAADGLGRALVSLSAPLGIESLPADEATELLAAYHDGALALGAPFGVWASVPLRAIDPAGLDGQLDRGCVGLQLPATALAGPGGYAHVSPLLETLQRRGAPLFIHPGPTATAADGPDTLPGWWPAVVDYVAQMHAAWFAFRNWGRPAHPRLRVVFAMLAGLAPLHGERVAARAGAEAERGAVDPDVFLETSSYGPRAIDAVVRVTGIDQLVHGSDRPYATPPECGLGAAAETALRITNPAALLHAASPRPRGGVT